MAKIRLVCEQCGGNIILDSSHEIGTCENCLSQFVIKQDQIVQQITQNVTKHVYGYEGKDVEELLKDGYILNDLRDYRQANAKFYQAIKIEPDCWSAWLGYASTGGNRQEYLGMVPAYQRAYRLAATEKEKVDTFVDMTEYFKDHDVRGVFVRAFNMATDQERSRIFNLVDGVIGRDDSEIANLAVDLCPEDWRAVFAYAKVRQIRARWCQLEGGFFKGGSLPKPAQEVVDIFVRAYQLAKNEQNNSTERIEKHIEKLSHDQSYQVFVNELRKAIKRVK